MIPPSPTTRGAFIVLEGVDRCGKTTQTSLLLKRLVAAGVAASLMRFPDRTTATGKLIDGYLQNSSNLDDRAIHLLFSANRWEASQALAASLQEGTTVICDRYAYSGVAFSASKINESTKEPVLSMDWCQAPDKGLPAPDCVIFLDLAQEEAEKRGGYGGERYEKRDMQARVRQQFSELQAMDEAVGRVPWTVIDAAQTIEQVEADIQKVVEATLKGIANGKKLSKMWEEGEYALSSLSATTSGEK